MPKLEMSSHSVLAVLAYRRRNRIIIAAALAAGVAALHYAELLESEQPCPTPILTGDKWFLALLDTTNQHKFQEQLGMARETFLSLVAELEALKLLKNTRSMSTEEQVAIFLFTAVTNQCTRKVAERFQRSENTVSRTFHKVLDALAHPTFYPKYVKQPSAITPLPIHLKEDPKFIPFFKDAIGAIDGVHTPVSPPENDRARCRDRRGQLSLNHLVACDFDMFFTYVLAGWEGSVADGFLFSEAVYSQGLSIPKDKYYLADAAFARAGGILLPFRGVRYREWGARNQEPKDRNELYNLRHFTYRNIVEQTFGVVRRRWRILRETTSFSLHTNAKIVSVLAGLHNFIRSHDSDNLPEPWYPEDGSEEGCGDVQVQGTAAVAQTVKLRGGIADAMWESYDDII